MNTSIRKLLLEDFRPRKWKDIVDKATSSKSVEIVIGSEHNAKSNPDRKWVEKHLDGMLMNLFFDQEFYYNYVPEEYANDYKRAIRNKFLPEVKKNMRLIDKLIKFDEEGTYGFKIDTVYMRSLKDRQKLMIAAFDKIKNQMNDKVVQAWKEYHKSYFGMNL